MSVAIQCVLDESTSALCPCVPSVPLCSFSVPVFPQCPCVPSVSLCSFSVHVFRQCSCVPPTRDPLVDMGRSPPLPLLLRVLLPLLIPLLQMLASTNSTNHTA
ncbi:hypothetical protein FHG87_013118 [Trinorchestia longiramus]|nr:hypothetical protein FHG87_013118 [Trinorchestia longiramus]